MSHRMRRRPNGETIHCKIENRHIPIVAAVKLHNPSLAHCMFCGDKGNKCKQLPNRATA